MLARLTREPVTTRSETGGNGMGLMFCQRVMQSIGGSIEIESEVGRGAAMTLYFQPCDNAARLRPAHAKLEWLTLAPQALPR